MTDLSPASAFGPALPLTIGDVSLSEVALGAVTFVQPFRGQTTGVSDALEAALGLALPSPGAALTGEGVRALWYGPGQALVIGACPDLPGAALIDQSDAWAAILIEGPGVRGVLARLTPLDLRPERFGPGQTARTLVGHMTGQITPTGPQAYEVMVFRSMAGTLLHDMSRAAGFVAGRGILG